MTCNFDSGIGIGIGFQGFLGIVELESELNRRLKLQEGIGIGIESKAKIEAIICGMELESELN